MHIKSKIHRQFEGRQLIGFIGFFSPAVTITSGVSQAIRGSGDVYPAAMRTIPSKAAEVETFSVFRAAVAASASTGR